MSVGGWLEERAGLGGLRAKAAALHARRVSRDAGRSLALGAALVALVAVQALSGSLLSMYYKPSWDRAHGSVESIVTSIPAGWLIRSVHVWGAHLMVAGILLHMIRSFWRTSCAAPRELTWMAGVLLLAVAALGAITGQLLPLDEEAYGGALVAAEFAGPLGDVVRGGPAVGDAMVGRFFAAHVFWIPVAGLLLCGIHMALVARHGVAGNAPPGPTALEAIGTGTFAALAILSLLAVAVPAGLGPPPDPTQVRAGVRPLWPFLPVYQLAKFLPSMAINIGGLALLAGALLLPFARRRFIRVVAVAVFLVVALLAITGALSHREFAGVRFNAYGLPGGGR